MLYFFRIAQKMILLTHLIKSKKLMVNLWRLEAYGEVKISAFQSWLNVQIKKCMLKRKNTISGHGMGLKYNDAIRENLLENCTLI